MTFQDVRGEIWENTQGKTDNKVPVYLHPIAIDIIKDEWRWGIANDKLDYTRPILRNSRNQPWKSGFGASFATEMKRLNLYGLNPRLVYHGLRTTNATLIASAVAQDPERFGGIELVQSLLGHHSKSMAAHYSRRAKQEHINTDSVVLLPRGINSPAQLYPQYDA